MEPISKDKKITIDEYYELQDGVRYELIDGELYAMAEPSRIHQELAGELFFNIKEHIRSKDGDCRVYTAPFGVRLSEEDDTVLQPDISVICDKDKLTEKGCTGAPDWIIEIASPGNLKHDYVDKLGLYTAAGVREYWIVNPERKRVVVYTDTDPYIQTVYTFEDTVKPKIYDDLMIDFKDILLRVQ